MVIKMREFIEIKTDIELKPCPFCGGNASIICEFVPTKDNEEINVYQVGCLECGIGFREAWIYDDIVRDWNNRVQ